jgi:sigma-54 dependent transcriptional regulator, acetoin dehydrogenase operon transcriptional activator AcoR
VCASHRKLRAEADAGRFRHDLYYRINGLTVVLPPLRERDDFAVLTQRMLADFNPGREVQVEPALMARLQAYNWPGNLRQYANVLRTASAMLDDHEDHITWAHLPDDVQEDLAVPLPVKAGAASEPSHNLQELGRAAIRQALDSSRGNMSQAAKLLGISRQTLYRKLND